MPEYTAAFGLVVMVLLHGAWREHRNHNRRDSALLAAFGAAGILGGVAAWLN